MALNTDYMNLPESQAYDYLRDYYTRNPNEFNGWDYYAYNSVPNEFSPAEVWGQEMLVPSGGDRSYVVRRANDGTVSVNKQLGDSWYDKSSGLGFDIPIGAFLPFAAAAGAAALGAGAGSGAGAGAGAGVGAGGAAVGEGALAGAGAAGMDFGAGLEAAMGAGAGEGALAGAGAAGMDFGAGLEAGMGAGAGATEAGLSSLIPAGAEPAVYGVAEQGALTPLQQLQNLGYSAGNAYNTSGIKSLLDAAGVKDLASAARLGLLGAGVISALAGKKSSGGTGDAGYTNLVSPYKFERTVNPTAKPLTSEDAYAYLQNRPSPTTGQPVSTAAQNWFTNKYTAQDSFNPVSGEKFVRDPNSGQMIPVADIEAAQRKIGMAMGGIAELAYGGMADGHLGGYSDGGRLLKGPGDGVSDSIPATIEGRQPARLADGEFVVPARIVSELGNGSTDAGARKLYAMMNRIQKARSKTVGKNAVARDSNAERHLPA